jgi:hypothetical protein
MVKTSYLIIPVFLAAGYLSLANLDNTVFWDDEADIAIVAKNMVNRGHLTGWDGRNLLAYRNGSRLDENFRPIDSPLGYLTAAASFRVFGISTWAGRFPFVLAGLAALLVLAAILRQDYGDNNPMWLYGTVAMALSVVFLLYIRQCRYYSLAMLFGLLTYQFYRQCVQKSRLVWFVFLSIAAVLMFYSNFMLAAAFLLALAVVHLIFDRSRVRKNFWKFSLAAGLFAAATVPYAFYYHIWRRPDTPSVYIEAWYVRKLTLLWWNLRELNACGYIPWIVVAGLGYFVIRYYKKNENVLMALRWAVLSAGFIVFLSLISPQSTATEKYADVRYLIPLVPFCAGLVGVFIWFVHRKTKCGATAILALVVTTNLLNITPISRRLRWFLPAYINEIHHNYPTAYGEAIRFLRENVKQDEKVLAWPRYANYPLMFYAGDKIKICCTLNAESLIPLSEIRKLDAPLLLEENFPDWIILFGLFPDRNEPLSYFSRPHPEQEQQVKFVYKLVDVLDVYWYDTSKPELQWHLFGPKTDFDRQTEAVYIMRRFNDEPEL